MGKQPLNRMDRARARARRWARAPIGYAKRWGGGFRQYRNEFAVCAIFREEAPFLSEWITFHVGVGASHFYLYNNFSNDNFQSVLAPWIARGMVTLTDWPVPVGQVMAYRHCLRHARGECRWLAFLDIDEFLFSPQATDIRDIFESLL
jgi:glycosyl transferase family 92